MPKPLVDVARPFLSDMRIATFNVNSIRVRLPLLLRWLQKETCDVVLLQETKCVDELFPHEPFSALGYTCVVHGQKSYNGVAILSRHPLGDVRRGLPGEESGQARFLEATVLGVRIASLYVPNGTPVDSDKYSYKKTWMEALFEYVRSSLLQEVPFVLGGDYNVCPTDVDVFNPEGFSNSALCRDEIRRFFHRILYLGLTEAWRALHPRAQEYSYWDYQAGRFRRNDGLRLDHFLLSPQVAMALRACHIDKEPRGWESPSDHTPVVCTLADL